MIIPNGAIQIKRKTSGGGIDPETGYAARPTSVDWDLPIPCQYVVNKYNALATSNNEHITSASYAVLIDEQPFDGKQVRLTDSEGNVLGEFSITQIEPLRAVCQIRIWLQKAV